MGKKTYKVATEEGAAYTEQEIDSEVELDLTDDQETALIAAGWLEAPATKKTKEEK